MEISNKLIDPKRNYEKNSFNGFLLAPFLFFACEKK